MTPIYITIPGRLAGKGRPRAVARGKFVRVYTPEKTRSVEAMVRQIAAQAMAGRMPLEGPVKLEITAFMHPAESWSKKRRASARWVTGKPDCDNVVKLVGDSFNNIVWGDDAQVASLSMERRYSLTEVERVEVAVWELSEG